MPTRPKHFVSFNYYCICYKSNVYCLVISCVTPGKYDLIPFCKLGKFRLVPVSDVMEDCGKEPSEEVG